MSSSTRQPSPGPSSTLDESIPTFNAKKRARSEDVEDERHSKKRFEDADPDPATSAESIALHEKFYFPDSAGGLSVFKVKYIYPHAPLDYYSYFFRSMELTIKFIATC